MVNKKKTKALQRAINPIERRETKNDVTASKTKTRVDINMALQAEILLPESFVVLQGMQGDGMWNTIDSVPIVQDEVDEEFHHVEGNNSDEGVVVDYESLASSSGEHQQHHQVVSSISQSPLATFDPMLASTNMPSLALNPLTTTPFAASNSPATSFRRNNNIPDSDSFIVVDDQQQGRTRPEERAIEAWNTDCRSREQRQRQEWLASQHAEVLLPNQDWWQTGGQLTVFKDIPTKLRNGMIHQTINGVLSPGTTVVGTEMVYLDCDTLQIIPSSRRDEHPKGVEGQVQMLKLESPQEGYVAFSVNGYCYLGPGLPSQYTDPHVWIWRVTYAAGAFVREGLNLLSHHIATLPYGSFIRVTRKTVNDNGIPRLWVYGILVHDEGATPVEGWISEYLNSASGERGPIAHPVSFPLPALYRVTLQEGAVIRSDVELSSKEIGHAPCGAVLSIVGRAFSEHPEDKCIERLKLAGNGGWVSLRLNEEPPDDFLMFEFVTTDERFNPDHPGIFHLEAQAGVIHQVNREYEGADLSSIDESNASTGSSSVAVVRSGVATDGPLRHGYSLDHCIMCLSEERNATIVHGETGHIACCLLCARILKGQGQVVSI